MKTTIKIESIFGNLLFEHEAEYNTIKKTLEEAVKRGAYLCDANLCGANLGDANLRGANLGGANLFGANLGDANLCGANLGGANLFGAYLCGANLFCANLGDANLFGANLRGANLGDANLRGANLFGAYLCGANLCGASLGDDFGKLGSVQDILMVGAIGSRDGYTTIFHTDKGVFVMCGCFRGTLDEFAKEAEETHGDNKHARDYKALIEFVRIKFEL